MMEKNLAIIGLRLIAIYLAVLVINQIPTWFSTLYMMFSNQLKFSIEFKILGIGLFFASFIIPIIIWISSNKFAEFIIGNRMRTTLVKYDKEIDYWNAIFCGIGILIFILVFPELVLFVCQILLAIAKSNNLYHAPRPSMILLIPIILKLFLSLILIFRGKLIVKLVHKIRAY